MSYYYYATPRTLVVPYEHTWAWKSSMLLQYDYFAFEQLEASIRVFKNSSLSFPYQIKCESFSKDFSPLCNMQTFFCGATKKVLVVIAENPNVAGFWSTCNFNCSGSHEPACCDTMQMLNCIKIRKATAAKCQKVQNCLYFFKWCRRDSAAATDFQWVVSSLQLK